MLVLISTIVTTLGGIVSAFIAVSFGSIRELGRVERELELLSKLSPGSEEQAQLESSVRVSIRRYTSMNESSDRRIALWILLYGLFTSTVLFLSFGVALVAHHFESALAAVAVGLISGAGTLVTLYFLRRTPGALFFRSEPRTVAPESGTADSS